MTVNYGHGDVRFPGDQAGKMGHIHIIHENEAWLDLLALPTGTRLRLGHAKVVDVTRLRNPCAQLDHLQPELMKTASDRDAEGNLVRRPASWLSSSSAARFRPATRSRLNCRCGRMPRSSRSEAPAAI